jgi:hypothetical protein
LIYPNDLFIHKKHLLYLSSSMLFFYDEGRYYLIVLNSRFDKNFPWQKTYLLWLAPKKIIIYTIFFFYKWWRESIILDRPLLIDQQVHWLATDVDQFVHYRTRHTVLSILILVDNRARLHIHTSCLSPLLGLLLILLIFSAFIRVTYYP